MLKKQIGKFVAALALLAMLAGITFITLDSSLNVDRPAAIACNESSGSGGGC